MKALYTQTSIISKLKKAFFEIFSKEGNHTKEHLVEMFLSVLCLNGFQSVRYNYQSVPMDEKYGEDCFLSVIPEHLFRHLIILSIDDTMVEKHGEHFENRELLFDHAKHNGSNYLNGHCFVSVMLSIPVFDNGVIHYLSFPIGYRMWTKEETKLDMAADMIREVMDIIGHERNVCLCCDSWYPKGEITELPQQYGNLALICNVRHDTALYDLPPAKTGKKGRPRVRGQKLSFDNFEFSPVEGTDYSVGTRQVVTNLFGHKPVHAIVTKTQNGSQRLFICTKAPDQLLFAFDSDKLGKASAFAKAEVRFLPLTIYSMRWHIEVAYYDLNP